MVCSLLKIVWTLKNLSRKSDRTMSWNKCLRKIKPARRLGCRNKSWPSGVQWATKLLLAFKCITCVFSQHLQLKDENIRSGLNDESVHRATKNKSLWRWETKSYLLRAEGILKEDILGVQNSWKNTCLLASFHPKRDDNICFIVF